MHSLDRGQLCVLDKAGRPMARFVDVVAGLVVWCMNSALLEELSRREKEMGIIPDAAMDAFLKVGVHSLVSLAALACLPAVCSTR